MMSNLAITIGILLFLSLLILITQPIASENYLQAGNFTNVQSGGQNVTTYNPVEPISDTQINVNNNQLVIKPELKNELQQGLLEFGQFDLLLQNLDFPLLMKRLGFNIPLRTGRRLPPPDIFDPEVEIPKYFKTVINQLYDFSKAIFQLYEKRFITNREIIYPNLPASSRQQLAENEYYVLKYFQELIKPLKTLNSVNSYQMDIFNSTEGQSLRKALFILYGKLLPYLDNQYQMSVTGGENYELTPEIKPEYTDQKWSELISTMSKINGKFYRSIPQYQAEADRHQYDDLTDF